MGPNEPLHVLLVGPAHTVHLQRWIKGLNALAIRQTLLSEKPAADPGLAPETYLLPGQRLPKIGRYLLGSILLPYLVRKKRIDVIHFQSIGMNVILGLFAPSSRLILSPWGSDVAILRKWTPRYILVRWVVRRASRVLTTSHAMKERLVELFDVDRRKIDVVSWGVDTETFRPARSFEEQLEERARWSLPSDKLVVTSNRTIGATYRTHELVKAFAASQSHSKSSHLVLVRGFTPGNNVARKEQEQYLHQLREILSTIEDSVTLLEQPIQTLEMASLLRASDVVVAIPKTDQRSSSALEAMASGNRVILSDIPPNRELNADGAVVTLVPEPVERRLSDVLAVSGPLDDESVKANLEFISRFESWQNQLQRVVHIYAEVLARV